MFSNVDAVGERYDISNPTVWNWTNKKIIPKPYKIGENTTRWKNSELDAVDTVRKNDGSLPLPISEILKILKSHNGTLNEFLQTVEESCQYTYRTTLKDHSEFESEASTNHDRLELDIQNGIKRNKTKPRMDS